MSFVNEIVDLNKIKDIQFSFRIIILNNSLFSIEGYKKIINITDKIIIIRISKSLIVEITGENFCVKQLGKKEVVILGEVGGVNFV